MGSKIMDNLREWENQNNCNVNSDIDTKMKDGRKDKSEVRKKEIQTMGTQTKPNTEETEEDTDNIIRKTIATQTGNSEEQNNSEVEDIKKQRKCTADCRIQQLEREIHELKIKITNVDEIEQK